MSNPESPQNSLIAAKREFSATMLANDAFFALLRSRLVTDEGLPELSCEPSVNPQEDGSTIFGVSTAYSMTNKIGAIGLSFSQFDNIDLFKADIDNKPATPAALILQELETVLETDPKPALQSIVSDWQVGYNSIIDQFPDQLNIDPFRKTIALTSDLALMAYFPGEKN